MSNQMNEKFSQAQDTFSKLFEEQLTRVELMKKRVNPIDYTTLPYFSVVS